jgi:hypothetical protein
VLCCLDINVGYFLCLWVRVLYQVSMLMVVILPVCGLGCCTKLACTNR